VNYVIIFPLTGEGILLNVQGLKDRETEVMKVFDDSVQKFVNLKPYATVVANPMASEEGHSIVQTLINLSLSAATVAIAFLLFAKARKGRTQTA
jgi:hypothetical protein